MATGTLDLTAVGAPVFQRAATRDPDTGLALAPELLSFTFDHADTPLTLAISATAAHPVDVRKVTLIATEAFTSSDTLRVVVGDGTDDDRFLTATTEAATQYLAATGTVGKRYSANGVVQVTLDGDCTGGAGILLVEIVRL